MNLHIDIETYCDLDLSDVGVYKYVEHPSFEVLLIAWAIDDGQVHLEDLATNDDRISQDFLRAYIKADMLCAHNAAFERIALNKAFESSKDVPINRWRCSMIKAAYCGLPLKLEDVSKALKFGEDKAKLAEGKALVRYFCKPCKPTKSNEGRTRNLPRHDPEKWEKFVQYCKQDVVAERAVDDALVNYSLPEFEKKLYILDQMINDRGIKVDIQFARNAYNIDSTEAEVLSEELKRLTGVDNPNSPAQLKEWLSNQTGKEITTLAKDTIDPLIQELGEGTVSEVLRLRQMSSKTSTKKYKTMLECACDDGRARGLFQFYGANRTGRWAGRLIQLQNLPQNHLGALETARSIVAKGEYETLKMCYDNVSDTLSQLIRTAFVASPGNTFAVADFSAIEARVIAWYANEKWRLKVFETHGKIYEASAALMFGVPIESVTKGSDLRAKGKVAELALGYQGAVGALTQMGGEQMGLSEKEMKAIVYKWRKANPNIVTLWGEVNNAAQYAMEHPNRPVTLKYYKNLTFEYDKTALTLQLPSGRKLFYWDPRVKPDGGIKYQGMNQTTKQWTWIDTYGGKFVENLVQGTARDLLADAMIRAYVAEFDIVMHVHDEMVCEVPADTTNPILTPEKHLKDLENIMSEPVSWAEGLPLAADGYITPFYKKD